MPTPQETAYPTLKKQISTETLKSVYTPSANEIDFVRKCTRNLQYRACMLTLLKCAQRLGYFVFLTGIPLSIPKYIAKYAGCRCSLKMLQHYDYARVRTSHINNIRDYLNIKPADTNATSSCHKSDGTRGMDEGRHCRCLQRWGRRVDPLAIRTAKIRSVASAGIPSTEKN